MKASEAVRARIVLRAARLLGVEDDPGAIELRNGQAWAPDGRSVSLTEWR